MARRRVSHRMVTARGRTGRVIAEQAHERRIAPYVVEAGAGDTDFTGAVASFVDFRGANLEGAIMTDAIVRGSLWGGATCPDGTAADDNGGTCIGTAGLEVPPKTRAQDGE